MLKQITAAVLLLAFMASSFCSTAIVMDYYANTAAYAKSCQNKAIPTMHCNGKCQMLKKLQQQEKQDSGNPERKQSGKLDVISSKSFFTTTTFFQKSRADYNGLLKMTLPAHRAGRLLRPPCAA